MSPLLLQQHCQPDTKPGLLTEKQRNQLLHELTGWLYLEEKKEIFRRFKFNDYYQTMAFINAVAWIAHRENHHPDISFSYNSCDIHFSTHSAGGVTQFDFICAAQINQLHNPA